MRLAPTCGRSGTLARMTFDFESREDVLQAIRRCFMTTYQNDPLSNYDGIGLAIARGDYTLRGKAQVFMKDAAPHYVCLELEKHDFSGFSDHDALLTVVTTAKELADQETIEWIANLVAHGESARPRRPDIQFSDRMWQTEGYRNIRERMKQRKAP